MKQITKSALLTGIIALTATALLAKPGNSKHGTDVLHFTIQSTFQNLDVEPGASGTVQARQNKQGNANNQTLTISLKGLTADTTYTLMAALGDGTNLTAVTDFTTDGNGNATFNFASLGNGKGGGKKQPLPAELDPVSNIHELDVVNAGNVVLSADFTSPTSLQYLVKRDISANDVSAQLRIKATTSQTQFRLTASGLLPDTDYQLVINGVPVQTNTSDGNGRLDITSQDSGLDILDVHSVALWDLSNTEIVSTTLP